MLYILINLLLIVRTVTDEDFIETFKKRMVYFLMYSSITMICVLFIISYSEVPGSINFCSICPFAKSGEVFHPLLSEQLHLSKLVFRQIGVAL